MNGRFCIGLDRYGRNFFEAIKDMGIGFAPHHTEQQVFDIQLHVFKDCIAQISNVITGDTRIFFMQVMGLPYVGNFSDKEFFNNPVALANFTNHFRMFAFGMYERITAITGVQFEKDYTVEACTFDYLVVMIEDKI